MADNPRGISGLGIIVGGIVLMALALFLFTGAGRQKVESDADLPKVTSPPPATGSSNTGAR